MTQTIRVVALEQSRQQRGWVFTPGEQLTTFAPKARRPGRPPRVSTSHPLLCCRSSAFSPAGRGAVSEGF